ncbi:MAG: hypothetical protein HC898_01725, partial [Phycisphaerales bacterium]|nr:hypothetical protein [Phycisphaerales bacterium]
AVYSPHTALDAVPGGLNDWWCDALGRGVRRAIVPHDAVFQPGGLHKIITFVPGKAADRVRQAMSDAGAGCIGAYSECSFFNEGTGTFRGSAGTHPTVGKPGRLEKVPEIRLEMVCSADVSVAVQQALLQTHPYEEPAFDVYPLLPPLRRDVPATPPATGASLAGTSAIGTGRILQLDKPVKLHTLLERLQAKVGKTHW